MPAGFASLKALYVFGERIYGRIAFSRLLLQCLTEYDVDVAFQSLC